MNWDFVGFFHSNGKEPVTIHWLKISFKGLQIDLPQIFIMRILISSWPFGSKFCITFSISLLEKFRLFKYFSLVKWRLRGSSLQLLIKEYCLANKELQSSVLFLKSVTYSYLWKRGGKSGIFYYSKAYLIMASKPLYFSVYELICILFENNTLIWKLQFR